MSLSAPVGTGAQSTRSGFDPLTPVLELSTHTVKLTSEERAMLSGRLGQGLRQAMEIIVALGRVYDAHELVPISSVQVAGVSYRNLGEAGLEFLNEWADRGARARVPATLNPAGIDLQAWRDLGFSQEFAGRQMAVIEAYEKLGVRTTCTCTPYLVDNPPSRGEHLAWSESSAVSYANSVLGARTNREGGPSALAAAIAGRTAAYGLHLERNRGSGLRVEVRCAVETVSDFGALGYLVGKEAGNEIPYFEGLSGCSDTQLKALGAAMAAGGAVALYHVRGITPESERPYALQGDHRTLVVSDLRPAYDALNADASEIDLVWFGCPHAGLDEIEDIVRLLDGRQVSSAMWITTARKTREQARREGLVQAVEASGGRVVADMCVVVAPMDELGFRTLATPSAKGAWYAPAHAGLAVRYGTVEQCVEAAIGGAWPA